MKQTGKYDSHSLLQLLVMDEYALFAKAILVGRAPGRVYLDSEKTPKVVAIASDEESRCYLTLRDADSHVEEWRRVIRESVARDQYSKGLAFTEYYLPPDADMSVHEVFRGMDAFWKPASLYHAQKDELTELPLLIPHGFTVHPVTDKFLTDKWINNKKLVTGEWKTRTDNVNGIRGFCVLHEDRIVSVCHIDYRYEDSVEIGVITDEKFRRRGLGTLAVANALNYFRDNGINNFLWHAPWDNLGSKGVAERCGLRVKREFGEYLIHYKPGMQNLMLGYESVKAGDFLNAILYYRKAVDYEVKEENPFEGEFTQGQVEAWIMECKEKLA